MSRDGHTITTTDSAENALKILKAERFDLLITDLAMPDMSGEALANQAKQLQPDLAIILLTGMGNLMQDSEEKPEHVNRLLGKPLTRKELQQALADLIQEGAL